MRKTILILAFLLPVLSFAQSESLLYGVMPVQDGKVAYTRIIEVKGANKDRLFTNIKQWAVNSYKSQKATLESEDKESGYMVYKGFFEAVGKFSGGIYKGKSYTNKIYHTLKIYVKDEKVKLVLTDIATLGGYDYLAASMTKTTPQPTNIEDFDIFIRKEKARGASEKRIGKAEDNNKQNAEMLDAQINSLLDGISVELSKNKSEFDF